MPDLDPMLWKVSSTEKQALDPFVHDGFRKILSQLDELRRTMQDPKRMNAAREAEFKELGPIYDELEAVCRKGDRAIRRLSKK